jgi:5-methylcytosine-specific restriction protein A
MSEPPAIAELRRAPLHRYCGIAQHPDQVFVAGACTWCGYRIVLIDPSDYRRAQRTRHRGDRHEFAFTFGTRTVKRNCRRAFNLSTIYGARDLVKFRRDPCCAECGRVDGDWEADHIVPLVDGGLHCPTNIQRLCVECHRAKTALEAVARRSPVTASILSG